MATLAQLQAEPWWSREIVTDELDWLGDELCRRTGRPRDAFGSKGNTAHLSGGHRSQEWIKNSDYCTNASYTVQSGLTETQARHIAACDWTPGDWGTSANRALMRRITADLFAAARAGQLGGVRQIFGTLNGTSATGLNVQTNTTTVPDNSHLDHVHITFDRTRMRDKALMARILDIITGDDMSWSESLTAGQDAGGGTYAAKDWLIGANWKAWESWRNTVAIKAELTALRTVVEQLAEALKAGGGSVDTQAILAGVDARLAAQKAALDAEVRDAVADLGEGGAAQVRADAQ